MTVRSCCAHGHTHAICIHPLFSMHPGHPHHKRVAVTPPLVRSVAGRIGKDRHVATKDAPATPTAHTTLNARHRCVCCMHCTHGVIFVGHACADNRKLSRSNFWCAARKKYVPMSSRSTDLKRVRRTKILRQLCYESDVLFYPIRFFFLFPAPIQFFWAFYQGFDHHN